MVDGFVITYIVMFFFGILFLLIFILLHHKNKKNISDYPKPTRIPTISFMVPAYNEQENIRNTIEALLNVNYPKEKKEIIVINDESKDDTLKIAQELASKNKEITIIDKKNSGKADSLNQALKIAKGELVAVVDSDSYPQPDSVMKMVGHFEEDKVAAVTSRVLVRNKGNILCRFQVMDYSIIAWTRKILDFVDSVYVTNGPLSIYKKEAITKAGGFDPNNLTEDIEVTWNLLSKGYKTRMSYSAIVYTTVPEDLKTWVNQRVRWNLGGLQTLQKYWRFFFTNPGNLFGYYVMPYVALSFFLALIGFFLLARFLWVKGFYYLSALYYLPQGYNFLRYAEFRISASLLLFLGIIFFILAIHHYKEGFKVSETGNKSILKILIFTFVYRPLYIIPLLLAIYKLARGDIRWYTK